MTTPIGQSPRKNSPVATALKWIGSVAAVVSLLLGLNQVTGLRRGQIDQCAQSGFFTNETASEAEVKGRVLWPVQIQPDQAPRALMRWVFSPKRQ